MKWGFVVRPSGRVLGARYGLKPALRTLRDSFLLLIPLSPRSPVSPSPLEPASAPAGKPPALARSQSRAVWLRVAHSPFGDSRPSGSELLSVAQCGSRVAHHRQPPGGRGGAPAAPPADARRGTPESLPPLYIKRQSPPKMRAGKISRPASALSNPRLRREL